MLTLLYPTMFELTTSAARAGAMMVALATKPAATGAERGRGGLPHWRPTRAQGARHPARRGPARSAAAGRQPPIAPRPGVELGQAGEIIAPYGCNFPASVAEGDSKDI